MQCRLNHYRKNHASVFRKNESFSLGGVRNFVGSQVVKRFESKKKDDLNAARMKHTCGVEVIGGSPELDPAVSFFGGSFQ
jgi:hypothetical protein